MALSDTPTSDAAAVWFQPGRAGGSKEETGGGTEGMKEGEAEGGHSP